MYDELIKWLRFCATEGICAKCDFEQDGFCSDNLMKQAADVIEDLQKRKHGKWERNYDGIFYWWECSECHHDAWYDKEDLTNFCPNCGADMRGKNDG